MAFRFMAKIQPEFYTLSSVFQSIYRKTYTSQRQQYFEQWEVRLIADAEYQPYKRLTRHSSSVARPMSFLALINNFSEIFVSRDTM